MGALIKLVDVLLFIFFLVIAIVAPLIDSQLILPLEFYPKALVDLSNWYKQEYNDYLSAEKPHFYVGLVGVQLFFQWPLAVINLYGIAAGKSWLHTTCLMYGASTFTGMVSLHPSSFLFSLRYFYWKWFNVMRKWNSWASLLFEFMGYIKMQSVDMVGLEGIKIMCALEKTDQSFWLDHRFEVWQLWFWEIYFYFRLMILGPISVQAKMNTTNIGGKLEFWLCRLVSKFIIQTSFWKMIIG